MRAQILNDLREIIEPKLIIDFIKGCRHDNRSLHLDTLLAHAEPVDKVIAGAFLLEQRFDKLVNL